MIPRITAVLSSFDYPSHQLDSICDSRRFSRPRRHQHTPRCLASRALRRPSVHRIPIDIFDIIQGGDARAETRTPVPTLGE